ncbi:MAG: hypothetical protein NTZ50_12470 [Chloroflexi bacterium]|nr:hypothetical protein [Chloroflexota bacterium]
MMKAWHEELWKSTPQPKSQFCKENGISTITLDKWLSSADAPALVRFEEKNDGQELVDAGVATDERVRHVDISTDSVAALIRAIKQHQASIDELKSRLRHWVDTL